MKITIDMDETELLAGVIESLLKSDKGAMKHILRSIVKEVALSVDKKTLKILAEKYVQFEHEINYLSSQDSSAND